MLEKLLASPNLACKEWVWNQYDHMVRTNTMILPGSDAAVIRVKETRRSIAMSLDGNGRYCKLNPREGAMLAVMESARNVVCSGARPLAITNCLNFASPERPEVMRAFSDTIDGIGDACRALGTPVTGGNVSFYNETEGRGVFPTPVIGMIGVVDDSRNITTQWFKDEGDVILILGKTSNDLGASEFLNTLGGKEAGPVPRLDVEAELAVQRACLRLIDSGIVRSAHDCSEGGIAIALAESCFSSYRRNVIGAVLNLRKHLDVSPVRDLTDKALMSTALLFSESPSRILITVRPQDIAQVVSTVNQVGVECAEIGTVGGNRLVVRLDDETLLDEQVSTLEKAWRMSLPVNLDTGM